jgi:hypothetical protein
MTFVITEQNLPSAYCGEPHPIIPINTGCMGCQLGYVRTARNAQQAEEENPQYSHVVPGAGPDDLSKVRLIVVSDFAGHWEALNKYPFFDTHKASGERFKKGLLRPYNAGGYLRMILNKLYGLDTYHDCWLTNALKCDPGKRKPLVNTHVKPCTLKWLKIELEHLEEHCPKIPMLIAGTTAFEALKLLYKEHSGMLSDLKLNGCRRRKDIVIGGRHVVFTLNPARPARCAPRFESNVRYKDGQYVVKKNDWVPPELYLPGSPNYSFVQDLLILRDFL